MVAIPGKLSSRNSSLSSMKLCFSSSSCFLPLLSIQLIFFSFLQAPFLCYFLFAARHLILSKLLLSNSSPTTCTSSTLFMQASTTSPAHGSTKTSPPAPLLQPSSYEALFSSHHSPRSELSLSQPPSWQGGGPYHMSMYGASQKLSPTSNEMLSNSSQVVKNKNRTKKEKLLFKNGSTIINVILIKIHLKVILVHL